MARPRTRRRTDLDTHVFRAFRLTNDEYAKLTAAAAHQALERGRPVSVATVFRGLLKHLPTVSPTASITTK